VPLSPGKLETPHTTALRGVWGSKVQRMQRGPQLFDSARLWAVPGDADDMSVLSHACLLYLNVLVQ
jgi:hypothetical protein